MMEGIFPLLMYSADPRQLLQTNNFGKKAKHWTANRSVSPATGNRVDQRIAKSNSLGSAEYFILFITIIHSALFSVIVNDNNNNNKITVIIVIFLNTYIYIFLAQKSVERNCLIRPKKKMKHDLQP